MTLCKLLGAKNPPSMDTSDCKIIIQEKDRSRVSQISRNLKKFISNKLALQKNIKGQYLSEKEKSITRNKKIYF